MRNGYLVYGNVEIKMHSATDHMPGYSFTPEPFVWYIFQRRGVCPTCFLKQVMKWVWEEFCLFAYFVSGMVTNCLPLFQVTPALNGETADIAEAFYILPFFDGEEMKGLRI